MKCWHRLSLTSIGRSVLLLVSGLALLWSQAVLAAQPIIADFAVPEGQQSYTYESPAYETKGNYSAIIADWKAPAETEEVPLIYMRTLSYEDNWSEWTAIIHDHEDDEHDHHVHKHHHEHDHELAKMESLLNVRASKAYQFKIELFDPSYEVEDLKFTFIDAPIKSKPKLIKKNYFIASNQASGHIPGIITREEWGADESFNYLDVDSTDEDRENELTNDGSSDEERDEDIEEDDENIERIVETADGRQLIWPFEYAEDIKMLVVHHTVSSIDPDEGISLDEAKQKLRNIQYFHAVKRGWGDIGYNYLIDPEGRIFEGRRGGEKVIGGHSIPVNRASIGIAMIGNYQIDKPPRAAMEALTTILTAKSELYNLDPLGYTTFRGERYPVVNGHRDTDSTLCPGQHLYSSMPAIKFLTAQGVGGLNTSALVAVDQNPLRAITDVEPQELETVEVELLNASDEVWSSNNTYLAYFDVDSVTDSLTFPDASPAYKVGKLTKSEDVRPGQKAKFRIAFTGGLDSGFVPINLTPILNGKVKQTNIVFLPVFVEEPVFSYELTEGKTNNKLDLEPGQSQQLEFTVKNTGNFTWNSDSNSVVKLGVDDPRDAAARFIDTQIGQGRIKQFSKEVAPGQSMRFDLEIEAPNSPIRHEETYNLVIDGLAWARGGITVSVDNKPKTSASSFVRSGFISLADRFKLIKRKDYSSVRAPKVPSSGLDSEDIRIHLSYFDLDETDLVMNSSYRLLVDNRLKRMVHSYDTVNVKKAGELVEVSVNGTAYQGNIVRLEPQKQRLALIELADYEQRPGWNQDLNDNTFRDTLEMRLDAGKLIAINELPLGYYLRGLAEVSNGSEPEVIKTLMIIARTYAVYYLQPDKNKFSDKPYDLDDSPARTQKYLGYGFEKRSPNVAQHLGAVPNRIVTYEGEIAITPYFSKSEGRTLSAEEVWGWNWAPWLQSKPDDSCASAGPGTKAGHGVGLSGCGAAGMAAAGSDYEEIIKYFYTGVDIEER